MAQRDVQDVARLIVGLERLARLAAATPTELLAAWLTYDAGIGKRQALAIAESIKRLLAMLENMQRMQG